MITTGEKMIFKTILGLIGLFIIYGGFKYSKATH